MAEELIEPPDAGATLARATLWTLAAVGAGLGMQVVMSLARSISKDMAWIDAFAELSSRPFGQMLTQMFGYGGVLLAVTVLSGRQTVIHLRARTTTVAFAVVLGVALQSPLAALPAEECARDVRHDMEVRPRVVIVQGIYRIFHQSGACMPVKLDLSSFMPYGS